MILSSQSWYRHFKLKPDGKPKRSSNCQMPLSHSKTCLLLISSKYHLAATEEIVKNSFSKITKHDCNLQWECHLFTWKFIHIGFHIFPSSLADTSLGGFETELWWKRELLKITVFVKYCEDVVYSKHCKMYIRTHCNSAIFLTYQWFLTVESCTN